MAGRRALVAMKHVGLNVAADPLMNSALVDIHGGVVVAVADDPGMHSSQNEQDSRYYADFARVVCLEPSDSQQAYDMTRDAFDISERFKLPVIVRLVTRLAHTRSAVSVREARPQNALDKVAGAFRSWVMLPGNARLQWRKLLDRWPEIEAFTEASPYNPLSMGNGTPTVGVITTGIAREHYLECLGELPEPPPHLHISAYPFPKQKVRDLASRVRTLLIIEEGYPFVERYVRGVFETPVRVQGKLTGELPADGELNPDQVRRALGLEVNEGPRPQGPALPGRPPQLCKGCPHGESFTALKAALGSATTSLVTSDIGCYTLGALAPYRAIESCLCMGASITSAKGAAQAGLRPVVAVIGDSTFVHSGITGLIDAISEDVDMTVLILDNLTTAMTGGQPTAVPSSRLKELVLGLGANPDHVQVLDAHPKQLEQNTDAIRRELQHVGLSVIILVRECIETARKKKTGSR